jgi:hypothetical protein
MAQLMRCKGLQGRISELQAIAACHASMCHNSCLLSEGKPETMLSLKVYCADVPHMHKTLVKDRAAQ